MTALDDGIYEVMVVDARDDDEARVVHVELALTRGARKGEVMHLSARGLHRDAIALLGLPATLHVEQGVPRLVL